MTKTMFRGVVAGSIVLLFGGVALLFLLDQPLPPELDAWVEARGEMEWTLIEKFALAAAVVWLVANIGLLFFARWSRPAFAASVVAVTALTPFTGPSVSTAMEAFLFEVSLLIDGFVIALTYFSDVGRFFEGGRITATPATGEQTPA